MKRIALIGARGYTGGELLSILSNHDGFTLDALSSRKLAGERATDHFPVKQDLVIESLQPSDVPNRDADAWVLALPNGLSEPWVEAIRGAGTATIVDLSADHRFVDWTYGLPEHNRDSIREAVSVANPGCYATGMQVALRPLLDLIVDTPSIFGISGYSGAGTKPSENNDPDVLRDNLIPYKLHRPYP